MAFPPITNLPAAPSRDQTPENFSSTADAFVAALPDFVSDVNAAGDYIDTKTISVGNDFQGNYSAGTTYSVGESVLYTDEAYYISLVDNNTGNAPDVSTAEWAVIGAGGGGGRTVGELQYFSGPETVDYPEEKWIICDGTIYTQAEYPDLYATIGLIVNGVNFGNTDSSALYGEEPSDIKTLEYIGGTWYFVVNQKIITTTDWSTFTVANGDSVQPGETFSSVGSTVAILMGGLIYYTTDNGANWSSHNANIPIYGAYYLSSVGSTWIIRGLFQYAYYSTDLLSTSWNGGQILGASGTYWYGIQSNGTWAVAVDEGRVRFTSASDASSWGSATLNGGNYQQSSINSNNKAIASNGSQLYYSTGATPADGWAEATNPFTSGSIVNCGSAGSTLFVVNNFGEVSTSTDGQNWSTPEFFGVGENFGGSNKNPTIHTDGSFYRVANNRYGILKKSSFSAGSWVSEGNNVESPLSFNVNSIWDGSNFVTLGGTVSPPATSADGSAWTTYATTNYVQFSRCIAFDGSLYLVGGDSGELKSSANLINWTTLTSNTSAAIKHLNYLDGVYVYVDSDGKAGTTSNLATPFTLRTTGLSGGGVPASAFGDSKIVISSQAGIAYSTDDGVSWTPAETPAAVSSFSTQIVYDGKKFVIGGQNGSRGIVVTSTDAITWTVAYDTGSDNTRWRSLIYFSGTYVLIDESGSLYSSGDGFSFERLSSGAPHTGPMVANSEKILVMDGSGFTIPFYTYNTSTSFAIPTQATGISNGVNNLFIRAEA